MKFYPSSEEIGIMEIFESLSQVVKVAAGMHHAIGELNEVH